MPGKSIPKKSGIAAPTIHRQAQWLHEDGYLSLFERTRTENDKTERYQDKAGTMVCRHLAKDNMLSWFPRERCNCSIRFSRQRSFKWRSVTPRYSAASARLNSRTRNGALRAGQDQKSRKPYDSVRTARRAGGKAREDDCEI
jgi:hypothetical protein